MSEGILSKNSQIAIFAIAGLMFFYGFFDKHGLMSFHGDTICQIAFWRVFKWGRYVGELGASQTKPAQVLLFGILSDLGEKAGTLAIRASLSAMAGGIVLILIRLSLCFAETVLGSIVRNRVLAISILVGFTALSFLFPFVQAGDSIIGYVFFSLLAVELWNGKNLSMSAVLSAGIALLFRIEGAVLVASFILWALLSKQYKRGMLASVLFVMLMSFWYFFIIAIQGVPARLDSGNAAGYFSFSGAGETGSFVAGFLYATSAFIQLISDPLKVIFYVLGFSGFYFAINEHRRRGWLSFLGKPIVLLYAPLLVISLNIWLKGGSLQERYVATFLLVGIAIGWIPIQKLISQIKSASTKKMVAIIAIVVLAGNSLALLQRHFARTIEKNSAQSSYFADDLNLIVNEGIIPPGISLLTEDDILYTIVLAQPNRFPKLKALQSFNILSRAEKNEVLKGVDYIYFSKLARFNNYLFYLVKPKWRDDDFRKMIEKLDVSKGSERYEDVKLEVISSDQNRIIIKVTRA